MPINNTNKINKILQQLKKDIESGEFKKYLDEILEKEKQQKEYINNKEFFEWIEYFVDKLHKMKRAYSTEDFLYMDKSKFTEKDINNEKYIGLCIFDLFKEIGEQQGKEPIIDDSWSFPDTEWYFKFNNRIFFICELIGQGTEYILREADENEIRDYLDLDLYFKNI